MGLPLDRPILISGHHTEFWHPGVVSKYLAADAAAKATGAAVVWLMVDQDRAESAVARYPVEDVQGRWSVRQAEFSLTNGPGSDRTPGGFREPHFVAVGLDRIDGAMARHQIAPNFAHQIAGATLDLLRPLLSLDPTIIYATDLSRTALFGQLVDRMARDPESCCRTYNTAVSRHPTARVRPLTADDLQDRYELPLWHLPPGRPRRHVYAEDLPSIPIRELAPKALLMTGLLRLAGCDLFIHGLGAAAAGEDNHEGYDHITGEWLTDWLNLDPGAVAPISLISATRFLPLSTAAPPGPEAVDRAVWLSHAAPHNPHILRDGYFDDAKRRLVLRIAGSPHEQRAPLFRQLHEVLDEYRRTHEQDLADIRRQAAAMRERLAAAPILRDRSWPFPLYPDHILIGLRDEIAAAFSAPRPAPR